MDTKLIDDSHIPVKRLQLNPNTGTLEDSPQKQIFLKGPIPMSWLSKAAHLPGKTLNVAIALWWLYGMKPGQSFKLTSKALEHLDVGRDAASDALRRLEEAGLIEVKRTKGQRPIVTILNLQE